MAEPQSNREWIFWGRHDPLFAVSTRSGKQAGGNAPWSVEEFLASGKRYFADVLRQWQQYGSGCAHCVEIGCGAGRITHQLVSHFQRVTAVDVSPAQLESARKLLGPEVARVSFALVTSPLLPVPAGSCDGVFSCEVFQHLDNDEIIAVYLREAYRVLIPGGSLCFQVPVRGVQRWSVLSASLRNGLLRLLRRLGRRRMMLYRRFSAELIFRMLAEAGFGDLELRVFWTGEQNGFHSYFFGRRLAVTVPG